MRHEIQKTDEEIEAVFNGENYIDDLVFTRETIDDFKEAASKHWSECGEITTDEVNGVPRITFRDVQVGKGARRGNLTVADFGPVRVCMKF